MHLGGVVGSLCCRAHTSCWLINRANPQFLNYQTEALLNKELAYFLNHIRVDGMLGSKPPHMSEQELVGSRCCTGPISGPLSFTTTGRGATTVPSSTSSRSSCRPRTVTSWMSSARDATILPLFSRTRRPLSCAALALSCLHSLLEERQGLPRDAVSGRSRRK